MSKCVVVAPRSIRSHSEYCLSIATHGATGPLQFRVNIYERAEPRSNKTLDYKPDNKKIKQDPVDLAAKRGPIPKLMKTTNDDRLSKDVTLPVTGTKTRTLTVQPDLPQIVKIKFDQDILLGSYVLEVLSLSSSAEPVFYEKQFLYVETETFSILIHSNKASYRPGELVRYRILIFDSNARPVTIDSSLTISIYDTSKNLVRKEPTQSAKQGIYSGEYQIPVRGKTGVCQIEAEYKDKRVRKQFEITTAERPNFQVIAKTPNFVSNISIRFSVGVDCYYSFGKPVTGMAFIKATPILQSNSTWPQTAKPVTISKYVFGTSLVKFYMSDFTIPKIPTCDSFLIETTVQEKATGRVVRGHDKLIALDYKKIPSKYEILLHYFGFFLAGQIFPIEVHIRVKSGLALSSDWESVEFAVAFDSDLTEVPSCSSFELDAHGRTEILVQVPPNAESKINFKVQYSNTFEEVTVLAKQLHVQVINPSTPKLNQKILFQVGCRDILSKLFYYIVGRGNVLVSQVVDMADKNIDVFEFESTAAMAPSSSLVVYYITDSGDIFSDETEFKFEPEILANQLTVKVSDTNLTPNQELTVTMTTGKNSQVALSSVDLNVLLENQGNDLSRNRIYNGLRLYDNAGDIDLDASYTSSYINLLKSGTFVLTDAMKFKEGTVVSNNLTAVRRDINYDYTADIWTDIVIPLQPTCSDINWNAQNQLDLQNTTSVRSNFSDTLLWQDVEYVSGMRTVKTNVPDTVTSWVLNGYSLNAGSGLGILRPVIITTFKPFFIDVRMPCSCKMNDTTNIQVTIYNYLDQTCHVEVTLDNSADDFDIVTTGGGYSGYEEYNDYFELNHGKRNTGQVWDDGIWSTTFSVKPKKTGPMKVRIHASSSVACDTVEKVIMVDPPGKTVTRTIVRPIFLKLGQAEISSTFEINIPPNTVPGSMKVAISVQGDKYSLELENDQPLKQSSNNVVSLLYANGWNFVGPSPLCPCQKPYVRTEHALAVHNFFKSQCPDGGFRVDGDCDQPLRDTTFTARVALGGALQVRFNMDTPDVVYRSLDWFASIQRADGSFPNPNPPHSPLFVEGPITTAYVLYTMLFVDIDVPGVRTKHAATINKAMENLFAQFDSLDIFSLVLLCRATQLNQDARKHMVLSKINGFSFKNEFAQRWTRSALLNEALPFIKDLYQDEPDIVTLFKVGHGLTQYLIEYSNLFALDVKNDAIIALNMLSAYTSASESIYQIKVLISSSDLDSGISCSGTPVPMSLSSEMTIVVLDSSNRTLRSTFEMDPSTKMINVMASGLGLATVEVTYEYNMKAEDVVDAYSLHLNVTSAISKEWQLNVCTCSKIKPNPIVSVMEIKFPPGFGTTEYVRDDDAMTPKIKRKELNGDSMTVYFEDLDEAEACFGVPLYRNTFVEQPLIGIVTIQDQDFKNGKPYISSTEYTLSSFDATKFVENNL